MGKSEQEVNAITDRIINAAYTVSNRLGMGFLEKVYENAMIIEMKKIGLSVVQQKPLKIYYDQQIIGEYYADLYVEDEVVVELKTAKTIDVAHQAQLLNYLKASHTRFGLIINFGKPKVEIKRMVHGY